MHPRVAAASQSFVLAHTAHLEEEYNYKLTCDKPGVKADIFAFFRDRWLPHALQQLRVELRACHDEVNCTDPTTFLYS